MDDISQIVETHQPVHVPGIEGLFIPSNTRGHVLKMIGSNTALVRWEVIRKKKINCFNRMFVDCFILGPLDFLGNKEVPFI